MTKISNISPNSAVFISHGGGPLPILGDEAHQELVANLKEISSLIKKPAATIVISAHWEASIPTITSGSNPPLIYDYSGFPAEAYEIKYPVKGQPTLAHEVYETLKRAGIKSHLDEQRGFDHGLFVPLKIMYPEADIPCIQISLQNSLDPAKHIKIGNALANLNQQNILILGSGFSFHNMKAFFSGNTEQSKLMNEAFEKWLIETCSSQTMSEAERMQNLIEWENAPSAIYCHPREEHLLPLHVCYGFAKRAASEVFEFEALGIKASSYLWN